MEWLDAPGACLVGVQGPIMYKYKQSRLLALGGGGDFSTNSHNVSKIWDFSYHASVQKKSRKVDKFYWKWRVACDF